MLPKNKKAEIAQSKKDNYTRWYKIKLTEPQAISIYGYDDDDYYENSYELYDSNFNEIRCSKDRAKNCITTDGKQPTGIYYLSLSDSFYSLLKAGRYYKIYWN